MAKKKTAVVEPSAIEIPETSKPVLKVTYVCPACGFQETISEYANPLCGGSCNYTVKMVRKPLEV